MRIIKQNQREIQGHGSYKIWRLTMSGSHHTKRLKPLLERYRERIEWVFLPPYSPDLNPVERVWWLMQERVTHNRWVKSPNAY
jgi:transposase